MLLFVTVVELENLLDVMVSNAISLILLKKDLASLYKPSPWDMPFGLLEVEEIP